jgi:hypothetical protein
LLLDVSIEKPLPWQHRPSLLALLQLSVCITKGDGS